MHCNIIYFVNISSALLSLLLCIAIIYYNNIFYISTPCISIAKSSRTYVYRKFLTNQKSHLLLDSLLNIEITRTKQTKWNWHRHHIVHYNLASFKRQSYKNIVVIILHHEQNIWNTWKINRLWMKLIKLYIIYLLDRYFKWFQKYIII